MGEGEERYNKEKGYHKEKLIKEGYMGSMYSKMRDSYDIPVWFGAEYEYSEMSKAEIEAAEARSAIAKELAITAEAERLTQIDIKWNRDVSFKEFKKAKALIIKAYLTQKQRALGQKEISEAQSVAEMFDMDFEVEFPISKFEGSFVSNGDEDAENEAIDKTLELLGTSFEDLTENEDEYFSIAKGDLLVSLSFNDEGFTISGQGRINYTTMAFGRTILSRIV